MPGHGEIFVKIHAAGSTHCEKNGVWLITVVPSGSGATDCRLLYGVASLPLGSHFALDTAADEIAG